MNKKIQLMDGATGTRLWALAEANGFERTATWRYNLEHPELVEQAEKEYLAAGSLLVCSNSFAVNHFELQHAADVPSVGEVVAAAVRIAKTAVAGTDGKVALDVGPLPRMLEPFGELAAEEAEDCYHEILAGGMAEQPDVIFFETFTSLEMLCIAVKAAKKYDVPILCSMSFERHGKTMMGDTPETIAEAMEALGVSALGLNCSFGPKAALPVIREFAACTKLPLILKPNVEEGTTAEQFAAELAEGLELVDYAGACCGSDPAYISALKARL